MLMLDTVDFPVVFWGALRAGVIPVPINTLLTPDMVGYVLEDSRAEAVVDLRAAAAGAAADVARHRRRCARSSSRGRTEAPPPPLTIRAPSASTTSSPAAIRRRRPSRPHRMRWRSGCIPPVRPARPRACGMCMAACARRPTPMARRCWGFAADDVMFSAAKAFHAYGLGNSMTFPMAVGAARGAAARPADARRGARHDAALPADHLRRRADAVRLAAVASADRAEGRLRPPAPLHLGRRGAARGHRRPLVAHGRRGHPGRHRLHRDAAYLHQQPAGRRALRHQRQAGAWLRRHGRRRA